MAYTSLGLRKRRQHPSVSLRSACCFCFMMMSQLAVDVSFTLRLHKKRVQPKGSLVNSLTQANGNTRLIFSGCCKQWTRIIDILA